MRDPVAAVYGHLLARLGPPLMVEKLTALGPGSPPLLARFAPGPLTPPIFASIGLSTWPCAWPRPVEAVLAFRPPPEVEPNPIAIEGLASLAAALSVPGPPIAIPGGPALRTLGPTHLLLAAPAPFGPRFADVGEPHPRDPVTGANRTRFVWLVPAFEDEVEHASRRGVDALLLLLTAQGLDPTDLRRRSGAPRLSGRGRSPR